MAPNENQPFLRSNIMLDALIVAAVIILIGVIANLAGELITKP